MKREGRSGLQGKEGPSPEERERALLDDAQSRALGKEGPSPEEREWALLDDAQSRALGRQTRRLRWQQQHLVGLISADTERKRELSLVDAMEVTGGLTELLVLEDDRTAFLGTLAQGKPHGLGVLTYASGAERWAHKWCKRRESAGLEAAGPDAAAGASVGGGGPDLGRVASAEDVSFLACGGGVRGGTQYVGQLREGLFEGLGVLCRESGGTYEGLWVSDMPEGYGIQRYPSGRTYLGEFRGGLPNGLGTMRYADGVRVIGRWREGSCVDEVLIVHTDGARSRAKQNASGTIAPAPPAAKPQDAVQKWALMADAVGVVQSLAREASMRARALESKLFPLVELIADLPAHPSDTTAPPPKEGIRSSQLRWLLDEMQLCRARWLDPMHAAQRAKQARGEPREAPPRERAYVAQAVEPIEDGRLDAWQFDLVAGEEKLKTEEPGGAGLVRQYQFPSQVQASELVLLDGQLHKFGTKLLRGGPELPPQVQDSSPPKAGADKVQTKSAEVVQLKLKKKTRLEALQQERERRAAGMGRLGAGEERPKTTGGSRPSMELQLRFHLAQQRAQQQQSDARPRSSRHVSQQRRTTTQFAQGPRETEYERMLRTFGARLSAKGIGFEIGRAPYCENPTLIVNRIRQELVAAEFQNSFVRTRIGPSLAAVPLSRGPVPRARTVHTQM